MDEVSLSLVSNEVSSLRIKITGGQTGDHFIAYLQGDWHCDCFGYTTHKHCRHTEAGIKIKKHIDTALLELRNHL